jgi:hypothetical protein
MEDRPKLRPQHELLRPADLEAVEDIVADLIEQQASVPDFMRIPDFVRGVAAASVGITVALIQRESLAPEDAAGRALAVAELVVNEWVKHLHRRLL